MSFTFTLVKGLLAQKNTQELLIYCEEILEKKKFPVWCPNAPLVLERWAETVVQESNVMCGNSLTKVILEYLNFIDSSQISTLVPIFLQLSNFVDLTAKWEQKDPLLNIAFWESVNELYMNLFSKDPSCLETHLHDIASSYLATSLDEGVTLFLRQIRLKAFNHMLEKSSDPLRQMIRSTNHDCVQSLLAALDKVGDYDIQTSLIEAVFRLTTLSERKRLVGEWFPNLKFVVQHLFVRIKDFDPDCRRFLNAYNNELGVRRKVFTFPCLFATMGMFVLRKPNIPHYEQLWVDFNIGSSTISLLFDRRYDQPSSQNARFWETIIIYNYEVEKVELSSSLQCHTLLLTLGRHPADFFATPPDEETAELLSREFFLEFSINTPLLQELCRTLYGQKLQVNTAVQRTPRRRCAIEENCAHSEPKEQNPSPRTPRTLENSPIRFREKARIKEASVSIDCITVSREEGPYSSDKNDSSPRDPEKGSVKSTKSSETEDEIILNDQSPLHQKHTCGHLQQDASDASTGSTRFLPNENLWKGSTSMFPLTTPHSSSSGHTSGVKSTTSRLKELINSEERRSRKKPKELSISCTSSVASTTSSLDVLVGTEHSGKSDSTFILKTDEDLNVDVNDNDNEVIPSSIVSQEVNPIKVGSHVKTSQSAEEIVSLQQRDEGAPDEAQDEKTSLEDPKKEDLQSEKDCTILEEFAELLGESTDELQCEESTEQRCSKEDSTVFVKSNNYDAEMDALESYIRDMDAINTEVPAEDGKNEYPSKDIIMDEVIPHIAATDEFVEDLISSSQQKIPQEKLEGALEKTEIDVISENEVKSPPKEQVKELPLHCDAEGDAAKSPEYICTAPFEVQVSKDEVVEVLTEEEVKIKKSYVSESSEDEIFFRREEEFSDHHDDIQVIPETLEEQEVVNGISCVDSVSENIKEKVLTISDTGSDTEEVAHNHTGTESATVTHAYIDSDETASNQLVIDTKPPSVDATSSSPESNFKDNHHSNAVKNDFPGTKETTTVILNSTKCPIRVKVMKKSKSKDKENSDSDKNLEIDLSKDASPENANSSCIGTEKNSVETKSGVSPNAKIVPAVTEEMANTKAATSPKNTLASALKILADYPVKPSGLKTPNRPTARAHPTSPSSWTGGKKRVLHKLSPLPDHYNVTPILPSKTQDKRPCSKKKLFDAKQTSMLEDSPPITDDSVEVVKIAEVSTEKCDSDTTNSKKEVLSLNASYGEIELSISDSSFSKNESSKHGTIHSKKSAKKNDDADYDTEEAGCSDAGEAEFSKRDTIYSKKSSKNEAGYGMEEPLIHDSDYRKEPSKRDTVYSKKSSKNEAGYGMEEPLIHDSDYRKEPSKRDTIYSKKSSKNEAGYVMEEPLIHDSDYRKEPSKRDTIYSKKSSKNEAGYVMEEPLIHDSDYRKEPSKRDTIYSKKSSKNEAGYGMEEPLIHDSDYRKEPSKRDTIYSKKSSKNETGYGMEEPLIHDSDYRKEPSKRDTIYTKKSSKNEAGYGMEEPSCSYTSHSRKEPPNRIKINKKPPLKSNAGDGKEVTSKRGTVYSKKALKRDVTYDESASRDANLSSYSQASTKSNSFKFFKTRDYKSSQRIELSSNDDESLKEEEEEEKETPSKKRKNDVSRWAGPSVIEFYSSKSVFSQFDDSSDSSTPEWFPKTKKRNSRTPGSSRTYPAKIQKKRSYLNDDGEEYVPFRERKLKKKKVSPRPYSIDDSTASGTDSGLLFKSPKKATKRPVCDVLQHKRMITRSFTKKKKEEASLAKSSSRSLLAGSSKSRPSSSLKAKPSSSFRAEERRLESKKSSTFAGSLEPIISSPEVLRDTSLTQPSSLDESAQIEGFQLVASTSRRSSTSSSFHVPKIGFCPGNQEHNTTRWEENDRPPKRLKDSAKVDEIRETLTEVLQRPLTISSSRKSGSLLPPAPPNNTPVADNDYEMVVAESDDDTFHSLNSSKLSSTHSKKSSARFNYVSVLDPISENAADRPKKGFRATDSANDSHSFGEGLTRQLSFDSKEEGFVHTSPEFGVEPVPNKGPIFLGDMIPRRPNTDYSSSDDLGASPPRVENESDGTPPPSRAMDSTSSPWPSATENKDIYQPGSYLSPLIPSSLSVLPSPSQESMTNMTPSLNSEPVSHVPSLTESSFPAPTLPAPSLRTASFTAESNREAEASIRELVSIAKHVTHKWTPISSRSQDMLKTPEKMPPKTLIKSTSESLSSESQDTEYVVSLPVSTLKLFMEESDSIGKELLSVSRRCLVLSGIVRDAIKSRKTEK